MKRGALHTHSFKTGFQDTIDAISYRMSQTLHFLCSETKTDTVRLHRVWARRLCLYEGAYLLAWAPAGKEAGLAEKLWV